MGVGGDDDHDRNGLAALLQPEGDKPEHVVASSKCHRDEATAAFESTVQHCLDLPPTDPVFTHKRGSALNLVQLLDAKLSQIDDAPAACSSGSSDAAPGRLGPAEVGIDLTSSAGSFSFGTHELQLESLANFSSCRASACVFKGKWQYECSIHTAGIQQIGWATIHCPFTAEEGVGDAPDSYAYDGGWQGSALAGGRCCAAAAAAACGAAVLAWWQMEAGRR
jgi:hypothetical protein